jgi:hypothetical protein
VRSSGRCGGVLCVRTCGRKRRCGHAVSPVRGGTRRLCPRRGGPALEAQGVCCRSVVIAVMAVAVILVGPLAASLRVA